MFWAFRIMVSLGLLMIGLGIWAALARWRSRLYDSCALHRFALWMGPSGLVAILAGWFTTEIGRQPWIVHGLMRTADAASTHGVPELTLTLAIFVVTYVFVFGAGIVYMLRLIGMGPTPTPAHAAHAAQPGGPGKARQPMRPLSAAPALDSFSSTPSQSSGA